MHENPDIGAFRVRDVLPVDLPRWYFPIVPNNADALVGLAAQRHIDGVGSVWLLGLVESADVDTWVWAQPEISIEASPTKLGEIAKLVAEGDKLLGWYSATLLGKALKTRGRRVGSKEGWTGKDEFDRLTSQAYQALKAKGEIVTQARMAEYLYFTFDKLHPRRSESREPEDIERAFQQDRCDYGYRTWDDLLNKLENNFPD